MPALAASTADRSTDSSRGGRLRWSSNIGFTSATIGCSHLSCALDHVDAGPWTALDTAIRLSRVARHESRREERGTTKPTRHRSTMSLVAMINSRCHERPNGVRRRLGQGRDAQARRMDAALTVRQFKLPGQKPTYATPHGFTGLEWS
jgi:hypothetical protein